MCPRRRAGAVRRSGENLLCAANESLDALPVVGLTERLADSLCLVFDALGYHKTYKDCCVHRKCPLLDRRETRHSGARAATRPTRRPTFRMMCCWRRCTRATPWTARVRGRRRRRLGSDLAKLRLRAAPVSAYSARCRRGEAALRRLRGTSANGSRRTPRRAGRARRVFARNVKQAQSTG